MIVRYPSPSHHSLLIIRPIDPLLFQCLCVFALKHKFCSCCRGLTEWQLTSASIINRNIRWALNEEVQGVNTDRYWILPSLEVLDNAIIDSCSAIYHRGRLWLWLLVSSHRLCFLSILFRWFPKLLLLRVMMLYIKLKALFLIPSHLMIFSAVAPTQVRHWHVFFWRGYLCLFSHERDRTSR